jgi:hypothetical protein
MNIHVWKLSFNVVARRKTENSGSKVSGHVCIYTYVAMSVRV